MLLLLETWYVIVIRRDCETTECNDGTWPIRKMRNKLDQIYLSKKCVHGKAKAISVYSKSRTYHRTFIKTAMLS